MHIYNITDIKDFTTKLFLGQVFDSFVLVEASFITFYSLIIDGRPLGPAEGGDSDSEASQESKPSEPAQSLLWSMAKPIATQAIKGKDLPRSFKIVLKLSDTALASTLTALGFEEDKQVTGLYMNIHYEKGCASLTCGSSRISFSLDKSLDNGWEELVKKFLLKNQIEFEEL